MKARIADLSGTVLIFEPPAYCRRQSGRQEQHHWQKHHRRRRLDELAQDMHTRTERLTHLMAKAEMELRRTTAQRCATIYMLVASIAAAVSAAAAAITAGIAAYVAFRGG